MFRCTTSRAKSSNAFRNSCKKQHGSCFAEAESSPSALKRDRAGAFASAATLTSIPCLLVGWESLACFEQVQRAVLVSPVIADGVYMECGGSVRSSWPERVPETACRVEASPIVTCVSQRSRLVLGEDDRVRSPAERYKAVLAAKRSRVSLL